MSQSVPWNQWKGGQRTESHGEDSLSGYHFVIGTHEAPQYRWHIRLSLVHTIRICRRGDSEGPWLGDPQFDGRYQAEGDQLEIRAYLNHRVRKAIRLLMESGVTEIILESNGLTLAVIGQPEVGWVAPLSGLIGEIKPPVLVRERLLSVAMYDPEVRVRAGAAEVLLAELQRASPSDVQRFAVPLAESSQVRARLRVDAMWLLRNSLPQHQYGAFLPFLRVGSPDLIRLGILFLLEVPTVVATIGNEGRDALERLLDHPHPGVVGDALEALAVLNYRVSESELGDYLWTDERLEVRLAAIRALAKVGCERTTVELLSKVSAWPFPRTLRREAVLARQAITARLMPTRGSLALISENGGQISTAGDDDS
ncbi:MAG: HEAT repeat domain-containing protein [Myxococcales bacterium]|nr:HEAT repeat domain-containing protein [Myxococcales bacterium]